MSHEVAANIDPGMRRPQRPSKVAEGEVCTAVAIVSLRRQVCCEDERPIPYGGSNPTPAASQSTWLRHAQVPRQQPALTRSQIWGLSKSESCSCLFQPGQIGL